MPSSVGLYSPQLRLRLSLTVLALMAVAVSLLLAFASVSVPRSIERAQQAAKKEATIVLPAPRPEVPSAPSTVPVSNQPAGMWNVLVPWALAADVVAIVGLVVVVRMWRR